MKIDKYFHLYGRKDDVVFEEIPAPERKTGKWIRNDNGTWSCDQCNSWIPDEQHHYARFCLYCGAKMKGDKDENKNS